MSAYCSTTEVNSLLKSITIDASSKITSNEVDAMIIRISNTMDGRIVKQYSLPTTDAEALSILKDVAMKFAASDVLRILYSGTQKKVPEIAKDWHNEAEAVMKLIDAKKLRLEVSANVTDVVHTGTVDSDGNERKPNIKIAQEF